MTVQVRMFARVQELAGTRCLQVELSESATVADVRRAMVQAVPALQGILDRCAIAVDEDFADDATPVTSRSDLAVIPPVSGGS